MHSFLKWALAPVIAVALLATADTQSAKAQFGIGISIGNTGYGPSGYGHSSFGGVQRGYSPYQGAHGLHQHYGSVPRSSYYSSGYGGLGYSRVQSNSYYYQAPRTSYYGVSRIQPVIVAPPAVRYYGGRRACY